MCLDLNHHGQSSRPMGLRWVDRWVNGRMDWLVGGVVEDRAAEHLWAGCAGWAERAGEERSEYYWRRTPGSVVAWVGGLERSERSVWIVR